jgi:hypothetical protein
MYGGEPSDYIIKTSTAYTASDATKFQIHWFENKNTGEMIQPKTNIISPKPQSDGQQWTRRMSFTRRICMWEIIL